MDVNSSDDESLRLRIKHLEQGYVLNRSILRLWPKFVNYLFGKFHFLVLNSIDDSLLAFTLFSERDELHKDIEQLCMQQAGPGYLAVATKMHFQRFIIVFCI